MIHQGFPTRTRAARRRRPGAGSGAISTTAWPPVIGTWRSRRSKWNSPNSRHMSWMSCGAGLPGRGQQIQKQKIDEDAIALRQVARKPDSAAFFAADQDLLGQHQLPDVLEADRPFVTGQPEFRRDPRNDLALRKRSHHRAAPALVAINVKKQQRENLERVHEPSCFIDDAEAIRIAVGRKTDVALRLDDASAQRLQLRHHRFGIDAAEQADPDCRESSRRCTTCREAASPEFCRRFRASNRQQPSVGTSRFDPNRPGSQMIKVMRLRRNDLDSFRRRLNRRAPKMLFDFRRDRRRCAAAEMSFHLESVERRRIVAGGNDDAARKRRRRCTSKET